MRFVIVRPDRERFLVPAVGEKTVNLQRGNIVVFGYPSDNDGIGQNHVRETRSVPGIREKIVGVVVVFARKTRDVHLTRVGEDDRVDAVLGYASLDVGYVDIVLDVRTEPTLFLLRDRGEFLRLYRHAVVEDDVAVAVFHVGYRTPGGAGVLRADIDGERSVITRPEGDGDAGPPRFIERAYRLDRSLPRFERRGERSVAFIVAVRSDEEVCVVRERVFGLGIRFAENGFVVFKLERIVVSLDYRGELLARGVASGIQAVSVRSVDETRLDRPAKRFFRPVRRFLIVRERGKIRSLGNGYRSG